MKVLQFVPSLNQYDGGTTTYMQQLAPVMGSMCELHVCALGNVADFVPLQGCQLHSIELSMLHVRRMKSQWLSLLDAIRPDIVHVNCCWMPQCACIIKWTNEWRKLSIINYQLSIKILLTPHGMLEPWIIGRNYLTRKLPAIWLYQRKAVKTADVIVATAEAERHNILKLGWNTNVALVQNGIDVAAITPHHKCQLARRLLFMSRIHPKKGLELLFQALSQLTTHNSPSPLRGIEGVLIAGEGESAYIDSLRQQVRELGLADLVSFVGPVYGDEKWQLIREADVVVLPSYSENYGLIVAESLASGTPVLTTTGTPWQSLQTSGSGWWVEPSAEAIAKALDEILSLSADAMKERSLLSRQLALSECDIREKITRLYNLYMSNCVK